MEIKSIKPDFLLRKQILMMVMRTFIFLICTSVFSFTSEISFSQEKVKISKNQLVTVDEIFGIIREQTDYKFMYPKDMFKEAPKVQLKKGTIRVDTLLSKAIAVSNFSVILTESNTILIKQKIDNQGIKVSGEVTDQTGEPIVGGTILVKGTTIGVTTNFDGSYTITVPNPENVLVFSSLGFEKQEITVGKQKTIDVVLKESLSKLDEVVLTGYQKIEKSRTTGSFVNIKNRALENIQTLSILDKIEGLIPGLNIDRAGRLVIRGVGTFRGGNATEPLIVLDRHPIEPELLETINPDDIESITVLKDASAASIWGARAANGVIIIVSKKNNIGKNTPLSISFSNSISFEKRPDLTQSSGSTAALLELQEHQAKNGWASTLSPSLVAPIGFETYKKFFAGSLTETQKNTIINRLKNTDLRAEFSRVLLRSPVRKKYNLLFSGSGQRNAYYFSVNYNDILSSSQGISDKRITLNANNIFTITPKIKINAGITAFVKNDEQNGYGAGEVRRNDQYNKILDSKGNYVIDNIVTDAVKAPGFPYDWGFNLKQDQQELDNLNRNNTYRLNFGINYDVKDYLNLTVNYQYNRSQMTSRNLHTEESFFTRNLLNNYTSHNAGKAVHNIPLGAILDETNGFLKSQTVNGQLNFNKKFNNHDVVLLAGAEAREVITESYRNRIYGYNPQSLRIDGLIDYTARYRNASDPFGIYRVPFLDDINFVKDRFLSTYFNLGYNYAGKYKFNASYRLDDSNLFGASAKYRNIPLWSMGIGWDITKETFFKSSTINRLVVRATRGTGGNIDKSTSPFTILTNSSNFKAFGNRLPFAYLRNPPNPTLRWEKTTTENIGLDFSLFSNRLNGSVEYYNRQSTDLLADKEF